MDAADPPMWQPLATLPLPHPGGAGSAPGELAVFFGDLGRIPPELAVDVLVVSAYPDDYKPMPWTAIRAVERRGISVAALAQDKAVDLRPTTSCWLSRDLSQAHPGVGFRRLLCYEPPGRPALDHAGPVGDIFRCLVPIIGDTATRVAMPLVTAGSRGGNPLLIVEALVVAALEWAGRGLPLSRLLLVENDPLKARWMADRVSAAAEPPVPAAPAPAVRRSASATPAAQEEDRAASVDVFISYAHTDAERVLRFVEGLKRARPQTRVFLDRHELRAGDHWYRRILEALDEARRVVCFYSPAYMDSRTCQDEWNVARVRHLDEDGPVLFPVLLEDTPLRSFFRSVQYKDCRGGDDALLAAARDLAHLLG